LRLRCARPAGDGTSSTCRRGGRCSCGTPRSRSTPTDSRTRPDVRGWTSTCWSTTRGSGSPVARERTGSPSRVGATTAALRPRRRCSGPTLTTVAVLLSLLSACAYGVSDFLGGIFARRSTAWQVATTGQASSTLCITLAALVVAGAPVGTDFAWGALAGTGSGLGAAFLYRGLAGATMSVVAPISAVGCALLPVLAGLALGERPTPTAAVGIVLAFPAIALISFVRDPDPGHRGGVL